MMQITPTPRTVEILVDLVNFHSQQAQSAIEALRLAGIPLTAAQTAVLVEAALMLKAAMDTAQIIYEAQPVNA